MHNGTSIKTRLYTVNTAPKALRRPTGLFLGLALLVFATAGLNVASALTVYPTNNGFEQPDLGSGFNAYQYIPSTPGWTFTGGSGIAANGSAFNLAGATNGNNDNGATSTSGQAAFLQGGNGTLAGVNSSQMLTLPAGNWLLFLSLEGRPASTENCPTCAGANGVNVFLDGVQEGSTLFPANEGSFNDVSVDLGDLSAGSHTIAFAGSNFLGGDRTTFIDNVQLSTASVPEPATWFAGAMAVFGSALFKYRRRT